MERQEGFATSHDGAKIYYLQEYKKGGVPLVFCDGVGCDQYIWKYLREYLRPHYRLIFWNYRGHGASPNPRSYDELTIENCVEDLRAVLDALKIQKAVFLGHSMGVQVILEFCHRNPDRVLGLVPVCGSYGHLLNTFFDTPVLKWIVPPLTLLFKRRNPLFDLFRKAVFPTRFSYWVGKAAHFGMSDQFLRFEDLMPYMRDLSEIDFGVFLSMMKNAGKHTAKSYLQEIQSPTLIIAGEEDTFTPLWLSVRMHERIPHSEFQLIPRGQHTGPLEHPDLVNLRVEKFLKERIEPLAPRKKKVSRKKVIESVVHAEEEEEEFEDPKDMAIRLVL